MTGGMYRQKSSLDELPPQFVSAMRTLFNLMDDQKTGYVKFSDIVNNWQEDASGVNGLPRGVIESLRKVTPDNGMLSFERFCAGLRICLLRHRVSQQNDMLRTNTANAPLTAAPTKQVRKGAFHRQPSSANCVVMKGSNAGFQQKGLGDRVQSQANTAAVRPNNAKGIAQQRAVSMPLLQLNGKANVVYPQGKEPLQNFKLRGYKSELKIRSHDPEPVPGVTAIPYSPGEEKDPECATTNRLGIMTALEQWRSDLLSRDCRADPEVRQNNYLQGFVPLFPKTTSSTVGNTRSVSSFKSQMNPTTTSTGIFDDVMKTAAHALSGKGDTADVPRGGTTTIPGHGDKITGKIQNRGPTFKRVMNRQREVRRHTVANGIDYNMVKRLKLLEQERDILLQGLDVVEKACEWYNQHISNIQDKMQCMGKSDTLSDYSMDAHQERIKFEMTRIFEVNQHLTALMESFDKGFPLHMNLAVHQPNLYKKVQKDADQLTQQRLKEQNRLLTEEVSKKSEQISQLEREKSALVRELFHARVQHHSEAGNETTFM